jgi:GntR family transcriptional regulator, transcriptional repressor for pyruvate dehydrogenase complex
VDPVADTFTGDGYRRDRIGAAEQVLNDLRDQILSGRLARGTRLPSEKELAVAYGVSAPTIREAVRALSAMSLLEARHGAGTFITAESTALMSSAMNAVVELENIDLPSMLHLSEAFYLKSADLAIREASDDELAELRTVAEAFHSRMDNAEFAAALRAFLAGLVAVSHNKLLITISAYLVESQISLAERAAARSPSAWRRIAGPLRAERIAIVAALESRDAAAAEGAVRIYMKRAHDLVHRFASEG